MGGQYLLVELQNHIMCTSQLNPRSSDYVVYTSIHHWFHNQNTECPNQRVVCDHCAHMFCLP